MTDCPLNVDTMSRLIQKLSGRLLYMITLSTHQRQRNLYFWSVPYVECISRTRADEMQVRQLRQKTSINLCVMCNCSSMLSVVIFWRRIEQSCHTVTVAKMATKSLVLLSVLVILYCGLCGPYTRNSIGHLL